jgi:nucleoside-diphosphate-sugar epimerase
VDARFLVTGADGCIGAWTLKNLVQDGLPVVVFDRDDRHRRPRLLLSEEQLGRVTWVQGDLTDTAQVRAVVGDHAITHVVHLAALQVPFCRADPVLGAQVNVVGTVNVFEAARACADRVRCVAYASSAAVIGPEEMYEPGQPVRDDAPLLPRTLYGVYKQANEGTARIYWQDHRVRSVGLRPYTVYGVGRDQGMTSDPTKALKAAVLGRPFRMAIGGRMDMQYADDVARAFLAAARAEPDGAPVFNLRGVVVSMQEMVAEIVRQVPAAAGQILPGDAEAGIAVDMDDSGLRGLLGDLPRTPLSFGVAETIRIFRALQYEGRLDAAELT